MKTLSALREVRYWRLNHLGISGLGWMENCCSSLILWQILLHNVIQAEKSC